MWIQLVIPLLLAFGSGLALGDPKTNRHKQQLGMTINDSPIVTSPESFPMDIPLDCKDLFDQGRKKDGVYTIFIITTDRYEPVLVFCDMTTSGGGWTVFQSRSKGFVDFYRNWVEYEQGFGFLLSDYWLGLRKLQALLSQNKQKNYRLRIDLAAFNGSTAYAEYSNFTIGSPEDKYTLGLGKFEGGTAGDSMTSPAGSRWDLSNMKFSTYDQNNDNAGDYNCAQNYHGAWWFNDCMNSHLNGKGLWWESWWVYSTNPKNFLKGDTMKFRPM